MEKGFYKTQSTTLVGLGGSKVETYRTDAQGNNAVKKISESEVDAEGNVTKQETFEHCFCSRKSVLYQNQILD